MRGKVPSKPTQRGATERQPVDTGPLENRARRPPPVVLERGDGIRGVEQERALIRDARDRGITTNAELCIVREALHASRGQLQLQVPRPTAKPTAPSTDAARLGKPVAAIRPPALEPRTRRHVQRGPNGPQLGDQGERTGFGADRVVDGWIEKTAAGEIEYLVGPHGRERQGDVAHSYA